MSFFVGPPGGVFTIAVWELYLSQSPSALLTSLRMSAFYDDPLRVRSIGRAGGSSVCSSPRERWWLALPMMLSIPTRPVVECEHSVFG